MLKKRIEENDNRFTAKPYLLLLQIKKTYIGDEEYGHDGKIQYVEHYTGDYVTCDSEEGLKEEIRSWYDDGEEPDWEKYDIRRFWEGYYWETVNVFLTDKGLQEHLELNRHNLGEWRSYGIHAFRNPEIKKMYDIIEGHRDE